MGYHESDQSVFNMALAYLKRIDMLLYKCQECSIKQDIDSWRLYLRSLYKELAAKLEDKEMVEFDGDPDSKVSIQELLDKYIKEDEANFRNINILANNQKIRVTYKQKILYLLDALEIKMRRKLQKKGMLLPSKDDPRYAVLRR